MQSLFSFSLSTNIIILSIASSSKAVPTIIRLLGILPLTFGFITFKVGISEFGSIFIFIASSGLVLFISSFATTVKLQVPARVFSNFFMSNVLVQFIVPSATT